MRALMPEASKKEGAAAYRKRRLPFDGESLRFFVPGLFSLTAANTGNLLHPADRLVFPAIQAGLQTIIAIPETAGILYFGFIFHNAPLLRLSTQSAFFPAERLAQYTMYYKHGFSFRQYPLHYPGALRGSLTKIKPRLC
jgi:hypothetical protein